MESATSAAPLRVHIDVTDTVSTQWRAGIQRAVCQLVDRLEQDPRLEVIPVVWLDSTRSFRVLRADERARLDPTVAPTPPALPAAAPGGARRLVSSARPLLGAVRRAAVGVLAWARLEEPLRDLRRWIRRHGPERLLASQAIELPAGSVLLELDTVWNNVLVDRSDLYQRLRSHGVVIAALVYDLLPQTHPDWFEAPMVAVSNRTIAAQAGADVVFAISRHTAAELVTWARRNTVAAPEPVVVELGADAAGAPAPDAAVAGPGEGRPPGAERYLLVVGTVEPRKNHRLLIEVMQRLWEGHPDVGLVVVGRPGWRNEEVVVALGELERSGAPVRWLRSCGDVELANWYDGAAVVLVPSLTEGYGLPVIEALVHGVPVVASDGGALPEAGHGLVDHVRPDDPEGWVDVIERHLDDPEFHAGRRDAAEAYQPPTWDAAADRIATTLLERCRHVPG
jgi:glycosyltransferase involved in cell wall biosynthesis